MPIFGRKQAAASPPPSPPGRERGDMGHEAVLRHLRALDATKPERRLQVGGMVVFDLVYQMSQRPRKVHASRTFWQSLVLGVAIPVSSAFSTALPVAVTCRPGTSWS